MKSLFTLIFSLLLAFPMFAQPSTNAPVPPARDAADVISVYGDAYTNLMNVDYDPNWGQSGHTMVDPAFDPGTGDLVLAYPNFNYQGTDFNNNNQDAALMEFIHIDIWVPMGTNRLVKMSPIDNSGNGPAEVLVDVPIVPGSWNSVDLAKTDFGGMSWGSVFQLKFDGQFNGDGTPNANGFDIYLDNIYFWKNPTVSGSDASLSDIQVDGVSIPGFSPGVPNYTVGLPGGTTVVPQVTSAITADPNATSVITQATSLPGTATVDVTSQNGSNMVSYTVDFVINVPSTSPPDPTQPEADVVSIYSDTYTNITVDNYDPNWGQSGHNMVDPTFDPGTGNFTLAYPNFNYQGTDFAANAQDLSSMEFLHVDIWVPAGLGRLVKVSPIDNSGNGPGEVLVDIPIVEGSWSSVDLPMSSFVDMSWTSVIQMKFDGQFNADGSANPAPYNIYLDNIYFWRDGTISPDDASLASLAVDGTGINGFDSEVTSYTYTVAPGTTVIPQVSATATDANASVTITQATALPGDATVEVVSADGTVTETYTVSFVNDAPLTAAPDPTINEANVISMYSDVYTDVAVDTWNTTWSEATLEDITIEGNATKKYTNLNFNGVETIGTPIDATTMDNFHIDVWSPNSTEVRIKLVDFLGDGFAGSNGDTEAELTFNIANGEWNSLIIPLQDFISNGMTAVNDLNQLIISAAPAGETILYVDNVYFSGVIISTEETIQPENRITIFPNPISNGQALQFDKTVKAIEIIDINGRSIAQSVNNTMILSNINPGLYLVKLTNEENKVQLSKLMVK